MRAPLNNDWPNWDHEIGDLVEPSNTLREPSEGAAQALRVPILPQPVRCAAHLAATPRQCVSQWARVGLLCLLVLAGLVLVGDNSEVHDPEPTHRIASDSEWVDAKTVARLKDTTARLEGGAR